MTTRPPSATMSATLLTYPPPCRSATVDSIGRLSALGSPALGAYLTALTADQALILFDNIRGASFMAGAMAAFVLNDTMMKLVFAELELSQAIFLRGLLLSLLLADRKSTRLNSSH